ncbi:MAG TPA: cytochrome c5 family protein, partial [Lysobacter sp.]|nr:cytochrome c5 family protein [Lysobacter sp.]
MRNYDLEFLKKFSMVIGFLMLVTLALIVAAWFVHKRLPPEENPARVRATEQRIAPVGAVYAGQTGAAQAAA